MNNFTTPQLGSVSNLLRPTGEDLRYRTVNANSCSEVSFANSFATGQLGAVRNLLVESEEFHEELNATSFIEFEEIFNNNLNENEHLTNQPVNLDFVKLLGDELTSSLLGEGWENLPEISSASPNARNALDNSEVAVQTLQDETPGATPTKRRPRGEDRCQRKRTCEKIDDKTQYALVKAFVLRQEVEIGLSVPEFLRTFSGIPEYPYPVSGYFYKMREKWEAQVKWDLHIERLQNKALKKDDGLQENSKKKKK